MELNSTNHQATPIDFAKTIEESRQAIAQAEPKKIRKGRSDKGKPRKPINPEAQAKSEAPQEPMVEAPKTDLTPFLAVPIRAMSNFPARKYRVPDLALTEDESKQCAEALNNCINVFIPDTSKMSPKSAAVLSLGMVVASIGMSKYQIYQAAMIERLNSQPENKPAPQENKKDSESEIKLRPGDVPAESYFSRQSV